MVKYTIRMKVNNKIIIGISVFAVGLLASASFATAQTPPATPPGGSKIEQRIAQRKKERNVKIEDQREQRRLEQRCTTAQGNVRRLQQPTSPMLSNRYKVYQRIDARLWFSIGQLRLAEKDSHELEKHRATLAQKTEAYRVLSENYQQVLDDVVVINCQADLVGFKALVETARIYHSQLRASAADIRGFVVNQIKPNLADHANDLQPKASTEEDD